MRDLKKELVTTVLLTLSQLQVYGWFFLGAYAKLRKATFSFVMSFRLSAHPHGRTQLTMAGFSLNLTFVYFLTIGREYSSFIKPNESKGYFT
jgi:hypothetical protein